MALLKATVTSVSWSTEVYPGWPKAHGQIIHPWWRFPSQASKAVDRLAGVHDYDVDNKQCCKSTNDRVSEPLTPCSRLCVV